MSRPPIPVILVAGFLGSGKTTLLNHLLRQGGVGPGVARTRIGVLVNDFGAINIDALLVAGQADGTVSLTNGCMCCATDRDGLEAALGALARPSAGIDAIVIEASGIAEPKALIRMITGLADPRLRYGGLVYVVDAATFRRMRGTHPELDGHVAVADLVVLNKSDIVDDTERTHLERLLAELNPTAPRVVTVDAVIDPRMLFDEQAVDRADGRAQSGPRQLALDELLAAEDHPRDDHGDDSRRDGYLGGHSHHDGTEGCGHHHLHDQYTSVAFETEEPMDPRRLADFLREPPPGCYRVKGATWFDRPGHRQRYVVHSVGGFVRTQRESWAGRPRATTIVAIGTDLDADAVRARLAAAVATPDTVGDEYGILHITRHLPQP